MEGSLQLLNKLKQKYILAVATGVNPIIFRDEVIPKFKVPNVFSQILFTYEIDDPEKHKPHPFMLQEIMITQKVTPGETIFVGDAKTDVQTALAADVMPVVVLTGHLNKEQAQELNVKYIIDDVTRLEEVLSQIDKET